MGAANKVAVVRGERGAETVELALSLCGIEEKISKPVVIKVTYYMEPCGRTKWNSSTSESCERESCKP